MQTIRPALDRFRAFLRGQSLSNVIDEDSGFTTADGNQILQDLDSRYNAISWESPQNSALLLDDVHLNREPTADAGLIANSE